MSKPEIQKWDGPDLLTCAEALCKQPYTLFFDSSRPSHSLNRYSILCWSPVETIESKNGVIKHNNVEIESEVFFEFLQKRLDHYQPIKSDLPFSGGAAGYFGYDLGRQLEKIPELVQDDLNVPDACIGIYTNVLVFNHTNNESWLIGDKPDLQPQGTRHLYDSLNWETKVTNSVYRQNIQKVIDDIYAGEVYQVNLSRRFEADLPRGFDSFTHYKTLRNVNAAPFSAYMNFGEVQLSSTSPERFLNVRDKQVETRPIKGTLPASQPVEKLANNPKDRAENTMIVDLLRNDLSKVCDFHSVKTPKLCQEETFEGLHHLVSTVTGTLKKDKTATDLLKACFPGGSITGAPKIRAMEIIEQLEPTRRGPYCGALGYIGFDGNMDTNIAIRTLIYANKKVYLQTGSGIVSDSEPEKELQESLDKAQKIFESFGVQKNREDAA